jgi:hypothetical protein
LYPTVSISEGIFPVVSAGNSGADLMPELFVVDPCFKEQFQLSNATPEYSALWQDLPNLFVGTAEQLVPVVELLCTQVSQSGLVIYCMGFDMLNRLGTYCLGFDIPHGFQEAGCLSVGIPFLAACSGCAPQHRTAPVTAPAAVFQFVQVTPTHCPQRIVFLPMLLTRLYLFVVCCTSCPADAEGVCRHLIQLPPLAHPLLHAHKVAAQHSR